MKLWFILFNMAKSIKSIFALHAILSKWNGRWNAFSVLFVNPAPPPNGVRAVMAQMGIFSPLDVPLDVMTGRGSAAAAAGRLLPAGIIPSIRWFIARTKTLFCLRLLPLPLLQLLSQPATHQQQQQPTRQYRFPSTHIVGSTRQNCPLHSYGIILRVPIGGLYHAENFLIEDSNLL